VILYEVRLDVDAEVATDYRDWLGTHVREILALPGFLRADILSEPRAVGRIGWCVHYWLADRAALDGYLRDHAPRLRADGLARFPGKFTGERRVLTLDERMPLP
jgi:hypothetical protein